MKKDNEAEKTKVKCKCGHSVYLLGEKKKICSWCGSYVYLTPMIEFKDKLINVMFKIKLKENNK